MSSPMPPWTWTRTESQGRYRSAIIPGHPNADARGRVLEHRAVVENVLGRLLTPEEVVHHLDENPSNNDPGNLQVMTHAEHTRLHHPRETPPTWTCPACGTEFVRERRQVHTATPACSRSCAVKLQRRVRRGGAERAHDASRYRDGCRCATCREAHRVKMTAYRSRRRARPV